MVIINKIKSISKIQILAIILIVVGVVAVVHYGRGAFYAYRELEYARTNDFKSGNVDPELIRPWMTVRYIAVAYAVPQEYLFSELGLPMERRHSETPLDDLNAQLNLDRFEKNGRPYFAIIDILRQAIIDYRENPVPTGLKEGGVRPWMSMQYVANSTGIPVETLFAQIGLPPDDTANMPLEYLADKTDYEGGLRALMDAVQRAVDTYEATQ